MTEEEYMDEKTCEFLNITLEEKDSEELKTIFKLTKHLGFSIRKEIMDGSIKLENNDFDSLTNGNREMYFLGSLVKLRSEVDKIKSRTTK